MGCMHPTGPGSKSCHTLHRLCNAVVHVCSRKRTVAALFAASDFPTGKSFGPASQPRAHSVIWPSTSSASSSMMFNIQSYQMTTDSRILLPVAHFL